MFIENIFYFKLKRSSVVILQTWRESGNASMKSFALFLGSYDAFEEKQVRSMRW